jgi:hypothetical protein
LYVKRKEHRLLAFRIKYASAKYVPGDYRKYLTDLLATSEWAFSTHRGRVMRTDIPSFWPKE